MQTVEETGRLLFSASAGEKIMKKSVFIILSICYIFLCGWCLVTRHNDREKKLKVIEKIVAKKTWGEVKRGIR